MCRTLSLPFFRRDMETCGLLRSTNDERANVRSNCRLSTSKRERERNLNVDEVFENYTMSVCFYLDYINLLLAG